MHVIFLLSGGKDTLITTGSAMGSLVQVTHKRTKDTSGPGASPYTRQCRPVAKRLTPEHPGRGLLILANCENCKTKHELLLVSLMLPQQHMQMIVLPCH